MQQSTYGEVAPMPCEDCQHSNRKGCSCKVSRHWETYGKLLRHKRFGSPLERVPDSSIVFVKHSWNK